MNNSKKHFVDIDGDWDAKGVIMHRDELLIFVRSNTASDAPSLKDMRYPSHLITLVQDAPNVQFAGQPVSTQALAVFKANVRGGGLLIADFGKISAFDKSTSHQRHMPLTVF